MEFFQNPVGLSSNSLKLLPQSIGEGRIPCTFPSSSNPSCRSSSFQTAQEFLRNGIRIPSADGESLLFTALTPQLGNSSLDLRFCGRRSHNSHLDLQTPSRAGRIFPDMK